MTYIDNFKNKVDNATNIIITTHAHPDADGIGSQLVLASALRIIGKNVICVNEEDLLTRYRYLDSNNEILSISEYKKEFRNMKPDLIILTDTSSPERTGKEMSIFVNSIKNKLFIDHHPCDSDLISDHCINTATSATGELVGEIVKSLGIKFDQTMAHLLYTAILIDTNSFRYPCVTSRSHSLISELLETGITPNKAYDQIYSSKQINHIKLLGEVLTSVQSNKDETIAWITLSQSMLDKYNVDIEDTHAFINHLLILENVKIACMFRERKGYTKISLRSSGKIDVGEIALRLGGGGHNHSAASRIEDNLDTVVTNTIDFLEGYLHDECKKQNNTNC